MKKGFFIVSFFTCFYIHSIAQSSRFKILTVGDQLPLKFLNLLNEKAGINRNKEIYILDFWSTSCSSCIAAMPKLDSLQRKYKDQIEVFLVNSQSEEQVNTFFAKFKKFKKPGLQFLNGDSIFSFLFPYITVPHHVWIDSQGLVLYITEGYNLTEENILATLDGKKIPLRLKEELIDINLNEPLLAEGRGRLGEYIESYSVLMSRISSYSGGIISFKPDSLNGTMGIKLINQPLLSLYQFAFSKSPAGEFHSNKRIDIEVKDPEPFNYPVQSTENEYWFDNYLKCYELSIKYNKRGVLFDIMRIDLDKYFPYHAQIEKRKRKVLLLKLLDNGMKIKSTKSEVMEIVSDSKIVIQNKKFNSLVFILRNLFDDYIIINETNFTKTIDLEISGNIKNMLYLNKELKKYGLEIILDEREFDILVIRDK